ncbi:class I SAM-dependent methyltransferase [Achromobacter seleniivolatilans]|uniref:Class I SAM-dependent methyltransferase n=1 Tax=Achromobacter seleniivolatilans TaxID=3047478 RepID=A0ABY9M750_9BURK|nr:class I SAM-dependent methyltransferase [Achromobacter sp. R39]WMD22645.1 class I SAM-dependent methyltransferase [Achromobacter sp. R39]
MTAHDSLNQAISDSYDETPYTSYPFAHTAPAHLQSVARLYGLEVPAPSTARVLELGCAAGGNLLPFAISNPQAHVVGIDLSPIQIAEGQALIEKMGVRNLDLRAISITDIDASFGQFDYIICHGVFSWVPVEVKAAILRICRENLSPNGVACISYNTYPGWKALDVLRDAMQLNSFGTPSPAEKLGRAKAVLTLMEQGLASDNAMRLGLQVAAKYLRQQSDHYLLHEYLEAVNSPCYFVEFLATAQEAGLAYVGDAQPESSIPSNFGDNVAAQVGALTQDAPRELREQFLDFAIGRQFRQSLLTHASRQPGILAQPEAGCFADMHFGLQVKPDDSADGNKEHGVRQYRANNGRGIGSRDAIFIAIVERLRQAWPASVAFADLMQDAKALAPQQPEDTLAVTVMIHLVSLLNIGSLWYRLEPLPYEKNLSSSPKLIPGAMALLQAADSGDLQVGHYNLWHQLVRPGKDAVIHFVARRLTGEVGQAELRTQLRDALFAGKLEHPDGLTTKGVRNLDQTAQDLLNRALIAMRVQGLIL